MHTIPPPGNEEDGNPLALGASNTEFDSRVSDMDDEMSKSQPEVLTRMVPEQYIVLRDPGWNPKVREDFKSMFPPIPAHDVEITIDQLSAFCEYITDHDKYFDPAFCGFSSSQERALVEQGWATMATRGGVWATPEFGSLPLW